MKYNIQAQIDVDDDVENIKATVTADEILVMDITITDIETATEIKDDLLSRIDALLKRS